MSHILIPRTPSMNLLRPFIECPTSELDQAWAAMVRIAEVQHARAGSQCLAQIEEPAQPVAEICSASHDDAQFGERAIKPLCDISGFEYGTPLYAGAAPAAVAPQGDEDDSLLLCASDLQHSAIYDSHSEMQDCARSVADRIKALAARALAAPALEAPGAREVTVERYEIPGGMRSALEDVISYLRSHGRCDLVRLMQELYTAISPWDGGSCSDVPDALVPARPDAEYLLSIARNNRWPMLMRAHIKSAALATAPALEAPAAPVGSARQFIEWMYSQPEDREPTTAEGALLEFEAHLAAAAPQAPAAPALSAAPIPVMPRAITAGLGLDDSGEEPAYCVMVAFRQEDDARYALSILSAGLGATAAPAAGNWIAAEEVDRLVRDLDVALHGEADAAPQASLCDIVGLAKAAAGKLGRPVLAAPAAPAVDAWLQPDDMAALQRFHETAEDDESYDIGKEAVARLCAFGCLQSHSFGRYSTTDFGDYLLDTWAGARTLPFTTAAERAAQAAAKGE